MKKNILVLIVLVTILSGCSFGIGNKTGDMDLFLTTASIADDASPSSMGPVLLADDEVEDPNQFAHVWVNLVQIDVKRDNDWITITEFDNDEGLIDLMSLRFQTELVGKNIKLEAGTYSDIRIKTGDDTKNKIVFTDGTEAALKIPSRELKPQTGKFTIAQGETTSLVLDIDMKYFVERGNKTNGYNVNPRKIIRFVDFQHFGSISGEIKLPDGIKLPDLPIDFVIRVEVLSAGDNQSVGYITLDPGKLTYDFPTIATGEYTLIASAYIGTVFNIKAEATVTVLANKVTKPEGITLKVSL